MKTIPMTNFKKISLAVLSLQIGFSAYSQTKKITTEDLQNGQNSISTAVPFLGISPGLTNTSDLTK